MLPRLSRRLKGGRVEYRADRYGIAHVVLGKASFTAEQLAENYGTVYDEILRMKPAAAKGKYVKSISVSSTMRFRRCGRFFRDPRVHRSC